MFPNYTTGASKAAVMLGLFLCLSLWASAQEVVTIQNRWKSNYLSGNGGSLSLKSGSPGTAEQWILEPVAGTSFVRLKNKANNKYIHNQRGGLELGDAPAGWWSAMWARERSGNYIRLKNRWKSTYIHNQNGPATVGSAPAGWWSAMWTLAPVSQPSGGDSRVPDVQIADVAPITTASLIPYINEEEKGGDPYMRSDAPESWLKTAVKGWMGHLPDNTPVRDMSIPGTHDSGARYGGAAAECQDWTIAEQLDAGIRYLDIRCRPTKTSFAIHHGAFYQKQMFGDVMNSIISFLRSNPTETVIIKIKKEHKPEEGSDSFEDIWASYASRYSRYLYQSFNTNPTLGELRGKVFVICQESNCFDNGMSKGNIEIAQRRYKVYWLAHKETKNEDWATLPSKKEEINKYIDKAMANYGKWVVNQLNGSTGMTPYDVARATNRSAYEHMGTKSGKNKFGLIVMDFPGEPLIYRIIKSNFDFGEKCNCPAKTYRSVSAHTWVEFRLPTAEAGHAIDIPSGAYNKYVFPKCNRVWWDDLRFVCNPNSCKWELVSGEYDADALCHGSKGSSKYVFVGER